MGGMLFAKNDSAAILAGIKGHGDLDPVALCGPARADWNFQSDPECRNSPRRRGNRLKEVPHGAPPERSARRPTVSDCDRPAMEKGPTI